MRGLMHDLVVITPEIKTGAGGVGDYTLRLLQSLALRNDITALVPPSGMPLAPPAGVRLEALSSSRSQIVEQLPKAGGKVLLQYSAYGFNRFGYPRPLLHALVDWKRKHAGRLVAVFHEIWTFWPITNKNFFVQRFHRNAIKHLVAAADTVFTSTRSQQNHLQKLTNTNSIGVLPVGSNIRPRVSG